MGQREITLLSFSSAGTILAQGLGPPLTDTSLIALVVAGATLVPPAVVQLHRLPIGRLVRDSVT